MYHRFIGLTRPCCKLDVIVAVLLALMFSLVIGPVLAQAAPAGDGKSPAADQIVSQGDSLRGEGQDEAALAKYEQALVLYRKAGARQGEAGCLSRIGRTREAVGDHRGAIEAFELSLPIWRELNDREQEAWALNGIGWSYSRAGNAKQALDDYARALSIFRDIGNAEGQAYAWHNTGMAQAELDDHAGAIASYQRALPLWRELSNRDQEAWALNGIGWSHHQLGENVTALGYFAQALPIFQAIVDREGEAYAWHNTGLARADSGQHLQAIEAYQRALPIWRSLDNSEQAGWALNGIGWNYSELGDDKRAIECYEQALALFRGIGERGGEGRVLTNLGWAYHNLGDNLNGIRFLNQALAVWRERKERKEEAVALHDIGVVCEALYQFEQAIDAYQQALAIWREIGDREEEAWALSGIGTAYQNRFDSEQAIAYLKQSVAAWQALGNAGNEAFALRNIGNVYNDRAERQQALDYYTQALEKTRAAGDRAEEAETANAIGMYRIDVGDYEKGLASFHAALEIWRALGDHENEARALNNIGVVYANLGDAARSVDYVKQALVISQAITDTFRSAIWMSNIAEYYRESGDDARSVDYLLQALPIMRQLQGTRRVYYFAVLDGLALSYAHLKDFSRAHETIAQALAAAKEMHDLDSEASALNDTGEIHLLQGNIEQARAVFLQALELRQAVGGPQGELQTLANLGRAHEMLGDDDAAIAYYRRAVDVIESIQSGIKTEELKSSFAGKQAGVYKSLINLLWKQRRYREAFDYGERARARAFLDQVAGGAVDIRTGANAGTIKQERNLSARIVELRQRLADLRRLTEDQRDTGAIASVESQLDASEVDYARLLTELKVESPEVASLVSVDTTPITDVQKLLDADTTLVEYYVGDDRTLAFVVTRYSFAAVPIEASGVALAETITRYRSFPSLEDPYPADLKQLYAWLIAPISDLLATRMVGIVPHGPLHYVPFAALTDGRHYLSDDHVVFNLPSASVLKYIEAKRKPEGNAPLVLGNPAVSESLPPLHYAEQEARAIADLYGTQALLGDAATESALRDRTAGSSLIHLAAHGEFNPRSPLFSTIYLAGDAQNDGRLEVHEIYGLDLDRTTGLVTLSACQTQMGAIGAGDDVVGLNRAFMYAGAPSVIASLWSVDDAATALLMERFYTHLKAGVGKGEALRQAQQDTRAKYPHPYYWAAFVLTGDPGAADRSSPPAATGQANRPSAPICGAAPMLAAAALIGVLTRRGNHPRGQPRRRV